MKTIKIAFRVVVAFFLAVSISAADATKTNGGDAIERELEKFTDSLAGQLRKAGVKKITILDLTDGDKNPVRIGAFIAEETTVNLAGSTNTFVVVDRANLNKILDEHKLSRTGLEDPENAKKLGHFSGVDAIVTGTITVLDSEVRMTAKIISTETADILGAAKGRLPKSLELARLVKSDPVVVTNTIIVTNVVTSPESQASKPRNSSRQPIKIADNSKQIGDLLIEVESLRLSGDKFEGRLVATLVFRNVSDDKTLAVAVPGRFMPISIVNDRGDEFQMMNYEGLTGIARQPEVSEIAPGGNLIAVARYYIYWKGTDGNFGPYRIQAEILVGTSDRGRSSNIKSSNFILSVPTAK